MFQRARPTILIEREQVGKLAALIELPVLTFASEIAPRADPVLSAPTIFSVDMRVIPTSQVDRALLHGLLKISQRWDARLAERRGMNHDLPNGLRL